LGGGPRLLFVTLLFAVAWLAVSLRLKEAYVRQLSSSLRSLLVGDAAPAAGAEAQLLEQAHRLLDSPFEKRALYALRLLERIDPEGLDRRLGALQDHPAAGVRAAALARLADPTHPVASPVLGRLLHDSSAEVRTAAIQLYAARFEDAPAQLERLLDAGDPAARAAALFHLLSQPGTASEGDLATRLDGWLRDAPPATRAAIAQALGRRPASRTLHHRLLLLVDDPDPEVQREAIVACGSVGLREFVPALVAKLASGATRDAARTALSAFGNRIVGTLGDELVDTSVAPAIRRELPVVLAQIGTQEAANELLRVPEPGDATLALRLLKAQNKIRTRDLRVTFPRATVREALQGDVERYLQLHAHLDTWRTVPPSKARDLLVASLEERTQTMFARIFRRLGLLYPPHEILLGYRALSTTDRRTRAQALEYLDSALLPEDRRLLVPLLEEPERRPILAEALYGIRTPTRDESLVALARGGDSWLQAGALYAIGVERLIDLEAHLRAGLDAAVPLVRETASWSLARLEIA
jgi:AAA family ATP:ADP antiporter